ncbi:hypothetical protein GCM10023314_11140 [Algibacter agarivorans]|uniref:Por secretion system C-terminal sorting domain-containing protein n=1 Tax=Algibacter agarivorans TaxID=1109741 RepID=A0ABP9GLA3_9FLAO
MKNVIKHSKKGILIVTLFATSLSFANEASFYKIKNDAKSTSLSLSNVKEGNLLSIKDNNGVILYKELIQNTGTYRKGFDLTTLPDGGYFFEIDKDLEIETIPFTVKANEVVFNKEEAVTIFKPYVRQKEDFVYITKLNTNLKTVKIHIYGNYNGDFQLVHSDKIKNTKIINKIYKFKKGSYKIVLNSDNKEYTTFIN